MSSVQIDKAGATNKAEHKSQSVFMEIFYDFVNGKNHKKQQQDVMTFGFFLIHNSGFLIYSKSARFNPLFQIRCVLPLPTIFIHFPCYEAPLPHFFKAEFHCKPECSFPTRLCERGANRKGNIN